MKKKTAPRLVNLNISYNKYLFGIPPFGPLLLPGRCDLSGTCFDFEAKACLGSCLCARSSCNMSTPMTTTRDPKFVVLPTKTTLNPNDTALATLKKTTTLSASSLTTTINASAVDPNAALFGGVLPLYALILLIVACVVLTALIVIGIVCLYRRRARARNDESTPSSAARDSDYFVEAQSFANDTQTTASLSHPINRYVSLCIYICARNVVKKNIYRTYYFIARPNTNQSVTIVQAGLTVFRFLFKK